MWCFIFCFRLIACPPQTMPQCSSLSAIGIPQHTGDLLSVCAGGEVQGSATNVARFPCKGRLNKAPGSVCQCRAVRAQFSALCGFLLLCPPEHACSPIYQTGCHPVPNPVAFVHRLQCLLHPLPLQFQLPLLLYLVSARCAVKSSTVPRAHEAAARSAPVVLILYTI